MRKVACLFVIGLSGLAAWFAAADRAAAQRDDEMPNGVEVQLRGPVHEAFAEPTDLQPKSSIVVPRRPPDPIEEVPPDVRPEGNNVVWIPGYWDWDDEAKNFLWVSGFWRDVPPDRRWVSGYWEEVQGGWARVPGFWGSVANTTIEYLPEPPPPPSAGPSVPPPDDTSVYVPGTWIWRETDYYWRPGFYVNYQPGWVYVPARYYWTPYGYVFVDGYWDHPMHLRGVLFAPVRVAETVLTVARWTYTPQYVIAPDALLTSLFVRPATGVYYFGDYFGQRYVQSGYVPWVDYRVNREVYDTNFAYYRTLYRNDPQWVRGFRDLYVAREQGTIPAPPRTLAQQRQIVQNVANIQNINTTVLRNLNIQNVQNIVQVAAPVHQVQNLHVDLLGAATRATAGTAAANAVASNSIRLQAVSQDMQQRFRQEASTFRNVQHQRREAEARLAQQGGAATANRARSLRLDLPHAPALAGHTEQPAGRAGQAPAHRQPPPAPQVPHAQERAGQVGREAPAGRAEQPGRAERPATTGRPNEPRRTEPGRAERPGSPEQPNRPDLTRPQPPARPETPRTPPAPPQRPDRPPVPERPGAERPNTPPRPNPPERPPQTNRPEVPPRPGTPERPPQTNPPAVPSRPGYPPVPPAPERTPPANPNRPEPQRPPLPPQTNRPEPPARPPVPPERPGNPVPPGTQRPPAPAPAPGVPGRPPERPPERPPQSNRPENPPRPPAPPERPGTPGHPERPPS